MFEGLTIFRLSAAMARHAGTRQAVVAQNIANADTPGYKARDVTEFSVLVARASGTGGAGFATRATRPGHLHGIGGALTPEIVESTSTPGNPNGNEVSLEDEMLKAVAVKREHDRALAIYRHGLTILRATLGRG